MGLGPLDCEVGVQVKDIPLGFDYIEINFQETAFKSSWKSLVK